MKNNEILSSNLNLETRDQIIRNAEALRAHYLRSFAAAGRKAIADYVRSRMPSGSRTA